MARDPRRAAPVDADEAARREVETPAARNAVERPVLHSDGVVCA
jgi:hypothetical protein